MAKPISASVPQLPPSAITASARGGDGEVARVPDPGHDDVVDPFVRLCAALALQDPIAAPPAFLGALEAAAAMTSPSPPVTTVQPRSASKRPTPGPRLVLAAAADDGDLNWPRVRDARPRGPGRRGAAH